MPFVTVPGLKGKVYIPDDKPECSKKHPCRDCYSCQMCSDDRCEVCRDHGACRNPHKRAKPVIQTLKLNET